jgi:hypothetical protein
VAWGCTQLMTSGHPKSLHSIPWERTLSTTVEAPPQIATSCGLWISAYVGRIVFSFFPQKWSKLHCEEGNNSTNTPCKDGPGQGHAGTTDTLTRPKFSGSRSAAIVVMSYAEASMFVMKH